MTDPDELLSASEIAAEYSIARKTVQRWERTDPPRLTPTKTLPGATGAHLFRRADVDEAMSGYRERMTKKEAEPAGSEGGPPALSELDELIAGV